MLNRFASRLLFLLIGACVVLWAPAFSAPAFAQEPSTENVDEGRQLAKDAMGHYKEAEYEPALELFLKAEKVYPAGQVLRMTGYTLMALERWLEAAEYLEKALKATYKPLVPRDAEHAQDNLAEVMKKIATIEVISNIAGAKVTIDDGPEEKLPHKQRLLPGQHSIVVTAPDHKPRKKKVTLEGGDSKQLTLDPKPMSDPDPEPDPEPDPQPQPDPELDTPTDVFGWFPGQGFVGLAAGGVGFVMGIVAIGVGAYGVSLRSAVQDNINAHNTSYDSGCTQNRDLCLADIELINNDGERAQDYQTAGIALGITGAALFAVGTTLFLMSDMSPLAPDEEETSSSGRVACGPTLGGVSCFGEF